MSRTLSTHQPRERLALVLWQVLTGNPRLDLRLPQCGGRDLRPLHAQHIHHALWRVACARGGMGWWSLRLHLRATWWWRARPQQTPPRPATDIIMLAACAVVIRSIGALARAHTHTHAHTWWWLGCSGEVVHVVGGAQVGGG